MGTALVGSEDYSSAASTNGKLILSRWQAGSTGTAAKILFKAYAASNYNARVGIYSDKSGPAPDALLGAGVAAIADDDAIYEISISDVSISSGSYYWLAFLADVSVALYRAGSWGDVFSKTYTYGDLPDPAGTDWSGTWDRKLPLCAFTADAPSGNPFYAYAQQ